MPETQTEKALRKAAKKEKKEKKAAKKEKKEKRMRPPAVSPTSSGSVDGNSSGAEAAASVEQATPVQFSSEKKTSKKSKKRLRDDASDLESQDSRSTTERSRKRARVAETAPASGAGGGESTTDDGHDERGNPPLEKFRLSDSTIKALKARGIKHLFPIQARTFDWIRDGHDLIGRARTGMGKTLAFALPIVEQILSDVPDRSRGRLPRVVVLAPTRELVKQVAEDFETTALGLVTLTVYGGVAAGPQKGALSRGVDVVVGTPGRVLDLINQGSLRLDGVRYAALDEADRMLDMGFADDVQTILQSVPALDDRANGREPTSPIQVLLFSATLPSWVHSIARKFMKDAKQVDLVEELGAGAEQASTDVQHLKLQCSWHARPKIIHDLIQMYAGRSGGVIVFTETKREANDLVVDPNVNMECKPLHGDISQQQRESTLAAFKTGRIRCIVATDVAARGLDISGVDLVIQSQPPSGNFSGRADVDSYVHRSDRTGRAGRKGVCVTLYRRNQEPILAEIEAAIGNTFTRIGAPQPDELVAAAARGVTEELDQVHSDMLGVFRDTAKDYLANREPQEALAAALAVISGKTGELQKTSLLNAAEGYTTILFTNPFEIRSPGFVWNALREELSEEVKESIKGMSITADSLGAVFDVPVEHMPVVEAAMTQSRSRLSVATSLPELRQRPEPSFGGGGRGRGGFGRGRGRGGGRGRPFGRGGGMRGRGRHTRL